MPQRGDGPPTTASPGAHSVDVVADRDHTGAELVALDRLARPAPTFEHEVEVAAADAAVAHFEQHVVRPERRDRPLLHLEVEAAA